MHASAPPVSSARTRLSPLAVAVMSGLAFAYYLLLLTGPSLRVLAPAEYGLNFNSMLEHMLRGAFDVDPAIVREEGFLRDGKVYSYFGPFMALLRLPLLPFGALMTVDVTRISIALAAALAVAGKLRALDAAFPPAARVGHGRAAFLLLVAVVPLSGLQLQLLLPLMFHEVTLWAYAFVWLFLAAAARAMFAGGAFGAGRLALMALLAGLALGTRVSAGVALHAGLGLLLLVLLWRAWTSGEGVGGWLARVLPAGCVLALGLALVGYVNLQRWGSPLVFVDMPSQITHQEFAWRLGVMARHGNFGLPRVPFNLQYYFLPVWAVTTGGKLVFEAFQREWFILVEMPVGTPLLSDPLTVYLAGVFAVAVARGRAARGWLAPGLALLAGLGVASALVLAAAAASYRYRADVLAPLEWAALLGVAVLAASGPDSRRRLVLLAVLGAATVVMGHVFAVLHITAHLGSAEEAMQAPTMPQEMYWRLFTGWRRWP